MKKVLNLILAVLIISTASVKAQVTIGSQNDPHAGAVLDLQSNGVRGLLLPKVSLTSATVWSPVTGTAIDGMTVYNTSTSTSNGLSGVGIYVWSANKWSKNSNMEATSPYLSGTPADWVSVSPSPNGGDGSYANPYKNTCPGTTVALTPKSGYVFGAIAPVSAASVFGNVITFTGSGSVIVTKDGQVGSVYVAINNCVNPVTGISVSPTSSTLTAINQTLQLTPTISPSNATNKNVSWSSNNTAVATVSSTGLVTAVGGGTATITVLTEDGAKTAICSITVNISVTGVTLSPTSSTLTAINQTVQLTPTISPSTATNKNVTWTSSNTAIATISSTGLVTAKANGTATIMVTTVDGAKTATSTITVNQYIVDGYTLSEQIISPYVEDIASGNVTTCPSGYRVAASRAEAFAVAKSGGVSTSQTWKGANWTNSNYYYTCNDYNHVGTISNITCVTSADAIGTMSGGNHECSGGTTVYRRYTTTTRCVKN